MDIHTVTIRLHALAVMCLLASSSWSTHAQELSREDDGSRESMLLNEAPQVDGEFETEEDTSKDWQREIDREVKEFPDLPEEAKPSPRSTSPLGGGMFMGGGGGAPGYGAAWYPSSRADLAGDSIGFVRQSLQAAIPVWRREGDAVFLTANLRKTDYFTNAMLPDSKSPFPEELSNINLGLGRLHEFANGWSSMVNLGIGSASDKPFHSVDEMNVNLFGMLLVPANNERDRWMFSLMYSPLGAINFPIPGVAYAWNPSETLRVNIGLPFSVNWKPEDRWTFSVTYVPITNVNARATFQWRERIAFFAGYEWFNEGYFLADREEANDRFLGFEQRLVTGVQWQFMARLRLDVQGGFVFDRYFGEGDNGLVISDLRDRVNVAPGAFIGANLGMQW